MFRILTPDNGRPLAHIRWTAFIVAACWYALLAALGELSWYGFQLTRGEIVYLSRQAVWQTPLADLILFAALAVLVVLVLAVFRVARHALTAYHGVFAGVAAAAVLATQSRLAWWALIPLALGIGVRWGALAAARADLVHRWQRRTLPLLTAIPLVLALTVNVRMDRAEQAALARLPAAPVGAPNVLFIVWDVVRARNVSLYGYPRETTPVLTRLAQGGVTFDRAFSTSPWTLPSHASLFTGKWTHQLEAGWSAPMDRASPTLAEALARRGWRTAAFAGNIYFVGWQHGLTRGFSRAEDHRFSLGELASSAELVRWALRFLWVRDALRWYDHTDRVYAPAIRASFLRWLDRDTTRPWFAFINLYDAHDPYVPTAPFDTMFGNLVTASPEERARAVRANRRDKFTLSEREVANLEALFDGAIAMQDHDLGVLLEELRRRGRLENTLVIVTSDHGEQFGEHRTFGHGNDVHVEAIHVPLVMVLPGGAMAGTRDSSVVSLRDVPATIADVLSVGGEGWELPGSSLLDRDRRVAAGDTVLAEVERIPRGSRPWYPVRRGDVRSIVAWPHHLIVTADSVELYDLARDPGQRRDLAGVDSLAALRDALREELVRRRADAVPSKREPPPGVAVR